MRGTVYPPEQVDFLIANREMPRRDLAQAFNARFGTEKTADVIKGFCSRRGIKTGRTGRFEKGNLPYNTGTKGLKVGSSTSFKKGNRPKNWRPVGSERINVEGYVEIKTVEPRTWKYKHVEIWQAINGPVPKGHVIIFADRNKLNFEPDNLIAIKRSELQYLNKHGLIQEDGDHTRAAVNVAKVAVRVFELRKKRS